MKSWAIVYAVGIACGTVVGVAHSPWASRPVVVSVPLAPACQDVVIVEANEGRYACPPGTRGAWDSRGTLVCACDRPASVDGGAP